MTTAAGSAKAILPTPPVVAPSPVSALSTKEGTLWRVDSSGKWVKRWFELREDVLASYKAEDRSKLKNAIKVSKITKVAMTPGDAAGTSFTMTCGQTDYPFRADEPADAEAWVAVISKRMRQPNP